MTSEEYALIPAPANGPPKETWPLLAVSAALWERGDRDLANIVEDLAVRLFPWDGFSGAYARPETVSHLALLIDPRLADVWESRRAGTNRKEN